MRSMARIARSEDRGAVATIVALLLGMGVILGFAALSIDVGQVMWERRQVQNGADGAAFALAQTCADDLAKCSTTVATTKSSITKINDWNNYEDQAGGFDPTYYPPSGPGALPGVCYHAGAFTLPTPSCGAPNGTLGDCAPVPTTLDPLLPYVEVHSRTRQSADNSSLLPRWISQTIMGQPTSGTNVAACSRAAWGTPGSYSGDVPITMSTCEWQDATNFGASWVADGPTGAWPGYGGAGRPPMPARYTWPNTPGQEVIIYLHGNTVDNNCPNSNGRDTGGGFGYLDPASGTCSSLVTTGNWAQIDTGNSATNTCQTALRNLHGTVIKVPVFNCLFRDNTAPTWDPKTDTTHSCLANTGGGNTYYHIEGWALFYLSGYKIGGGPADEKASVVNGVVPCSGNLRCISGWFLKGTLEATSITYTPGGPNYGTSAVVPAG